MHAVEADLLGRRGETPVAYYSADIAQVIKNFIIPAVFTCSGKVKPWPNFTSRSRPKVEKQALGKSNSVSVSPIS